VVREHLRLRKTTKKLRLLKEVPLLGSQLQAVKVVLEI
jgi:hypothetical protein